MKKKILFVVNVDWFFISHRLPIALACIEQGFEVHVACATTGRQSDIEKFGIFVHTIPLVRGSLSPYNFFRSILAITHILKSIKFDIIHLIAIQSIIIGGISTKILGVGPLIISISGLGYIFTGNGIPFFLKRKLIGGLLKFSLRGGKKHFIFQNLDDLKVLSNLISIKKSEITLIHGSGVDLVNFYYQPLLPENIVFIMVSRLLKDKGVIEFCESAKKFKALGYKADFFLVGEIDDGNPASLTKQEKELLPRIYNVQLLGHREDVDFLMANSSVVVLPSYREGFPKVLIEAAAAGRAVITSDVPGCRDAVSTDSAILIKPRNVTSLTEAMIYLSKYKNRIENMGLASRKLALDKYDISNVINKHLYVYQETLKNNF